jgi:hypothetical protein
VLTLIASPADNERGPRYMERVLAAIHHARLGSPPITLIFGTVVGQIGLLFRCTQAQHQLVLDPLMANYPDCSFKVIEEPQVPVGWRTWSQNVALSPELYPILRFAQFEDSLNHNYADPVSNLLRAIRPEEGIECSLEFHVCPASHRRRHQAMQAIRCLGRDFFRHHHRLAEFYARHALRGRCRTVAWLIGRLARKSDAPGHSLLETSTSRLHERENDLLAAADKIGSHLFETAIRLIVHAPPERETAAKARLQGMVAALGAFTKERLASFQAGPVHSGLPRRHSATFLFAHEELATMIHPPTSMAAAEKMPGNEFLELEGPVRFHSEEEEGSVPLGRMKFRADQRIVALGLEDRRRHVYLCGKTGMGKTTLLQNMMIADLRAGRSFCLIDPHGDLAESIIAQIPSHRSNDVIYFDAADRLLALPFNPLACSDESQIDQVTSNVVSCLKKLNDSWGPRLEDTLRNAVFAVVEQGGNLLSVMRLLGEPAFRAQTVIRIRDEIVRSFWLREFASWPDAYRVEAVAAITNKLRPLLTNRNIPPTTCRATNVNPISSSSMSFPFFRLPLMYSLGRLLRFENSKSGSWPLFREPSSFPNAPKTGCSMRSSASAEPRLFFGTRIRWTRNFLGNW